MASPPAARRSRDILLLALVGASACVLVAAGAAADGRSRLPESPAYIGGTFLRTIPIRPYLGGHSLEPHTLLRNATYRYVGRGLDTPHADFFDTLNSTAHDVLKNLNATLELRHWPATGPAICQAEVEQPVPMESAQRAAKLAAFEAVDVELTSYGGDDSVLVQTENSSPMSGYLFTVLAKEGYNVTALPLNLSHATALLPFIDSMPFELVTVLGTVLQFSGASFFPVTIPVQNVILIAMAEAFGLQQAFIYNRIQSIWVDQHRALARLGVYTYINSNMSSIYMMGGELLPSSLAAAAAAAGMEVTASIVSSRALGTQIEELLGADAFAASLANPETNATHGRHAINLTDGEMIGVTLGSITMLILMLAGIVFCGSRILARNHEEARKRLAAPQIVREILPTPTPRPTRPAELGPAYSVRRSEPAMEHSILDAVWKINVSELAICKRPNGADWILGVGSFGQVYRGLRGGVQDVALKVVKPGAVPLKMFEKELAVLRHLNLDKNLVQFYGVSHSNGTLVLVMEYMSGGDLTTALGNDADGVLAWHNKGAEILLDVARGLHFLHSNRVAHRDLKGRNILLSSAFEAKIGDVGLAAIVGSQAASSQLETKGTFAYAAPELLLGGPCDQKVDLYSFGVVCWEVVTHELPARGDLRQIRVPEEAPREPEARPTAKEAFEMLHFLLNTPTADPLRHTTDTVDRSSAPTLDEVRPSRERRPSLDGFRASPEGGRCGHKSPTTRDGGRSQRDCGRQLLGSRGARGQTDHFPSSEAPPPPAEPREWVHETSVRALAALGEPEDAQRSVYDTRAMTERDSAPEATWLVDSAGGSAIMLDTAEIDRIALG